MKSKTIFKLKDKEIFSLSFIYEPRSFFTYKGKEYDVSFTKDEYKKNKIIRTINLSKKIF